MDIPLHTLRYFVALAEELHFGAAARRLSISSPSLSQQVARLEATVGARLFNRSPRRTELTDAGRELLPLARRVLEAHADVVGWANARSQRDAEVLRIGIVAAGAGALSTSILVQAVARMPGVRLEMRRLGFFDVVPELLADRVDVVFAPGPFAGEPGIRFTPLWQERRVLVVPRGHRLAGRSSVGILETSGEVFVAASGGDAATLDWWLVDPRPDGSSPLRGPVADDIEGLLELCAAGAGVNIAAASVASHYARAELAFVPIHDIESSTIMLCARETPSARAAAEFESIAREQALASG